MFRISHGEVIEGGLTKDDSNFDRTIDPMAGSTTSYHDFAFIATAPIKAGEEIFVGDGHLYREPKYADRPSWRHYDRANGILEGLFEMKRKYPRLTKIQWIEILRRIKKELMTEETMAASLLPDTIEQLEALRTAGLGRASQTPRPLKKIQRLGLCLDNVREGQSSIPHAGRGAFATRSIPKGDVVSPAPLAIIVRNASALPSAEAIDKKEVEDEEAKDSPSSRFSPSSQLLENYCFGHRSSRQIRLCPLTQSILINHSQNPNVKLRWAGSANRGDVNPLTLPWSELMTKNAIKDEASDLPKLMLEFVALERIESGTEILFDYGELWERAYQSHVQKWTPPPTVRLPRDVPDLYEISFEERDDSHDHHRRRLYHFECRLEPLAYEGEDRRAFLEEYGANPNHFAENWSSRLRHAYGKNEHVAWYPCEVAAVEDDGVTFEVKVFSKSSNKARLIRHLRRTPHEAIRFQDGPYRSDQHLPSAFRHYVPIPDDLFPFHWRDEYRTARDIGLGAEREGLVDAQDPEHGEVLEEHEALLRRSKCGLYFAPSNIPDAGFSAYTAVPYPAKGIPVGSYSSAIVVPHLFLNELNPSQGQDYVWNARSFGAEFEVDTDRKSVVWALALANFHPGLINIQPNRPKFKPMLDRCIDPGAGAFSDYVDCSFLSMQPLKPGEELFVSYGERWFETRKDFATVALSDNYKDANRLAASAWAMASLQDAFFGRHVTKDLLRLIRERILENDPRTSSALANVETMDDLVHVVARNGTAQSSTELRSQSWFEEHGHCMDHVYVRDSLIPQAGKGAFVRRPMSKGDTIISSPLVATWGRDCFAMPRDALPENTNPTKLFLNYHFGHPESSVLFVPINNMLSINHGSNRTKLGREPNAELRWSSWSAKSSYFLLRPLEDLKKESHSTMVFDVVASRNIAVDEEILIDYGIEWEMAWSNHVARFEQSNSCLENDDDDDVHGEDRTAILSSKVVADMNLDKFNPSFHRWSRDHFTACHLKEFQSSAPDEIVYLVADKNALPPLTSIPDGVNITDSFHDILWDDPGFRLVSELGTRAPCKILASLRDADVFDVVVFREFSAEATLSLLTSSSSSSSYFHDPAVLRPRKLELHRSIPSNAIDYLNKPFRSDMHWKGAFRHEIKIPDNIFPRHWKDLTAEGN